MFPVICPNILGVQGKIMLKRNCKVFAGVVVDISLRVLIYKMVTCEACQDLS